MDAIDHLRLIATPRLLDCGLFKIKIRRRLIVVTSPFLPAAHFTVHLGERSGRFDLHKTHHDQANSHEPLGALQHEAFNIDEMAMRWIAFRAMARFLRVARPVRPGWLAHRRMVLGPAWNRVLRSLDPTRQSRTELTGRDLARILTTVTPMSDAAIPSFGIYPLYRVRYRQLQEVGFLFRVPTRFGGWEFRALSLAGFHDITEDAARRLQGLFVPHLVQPQEHVRLLEEMFTSEKGVSNG